MNTYGTRTRALTSVANGALNATNLVCDVFASVVLREGSTTGPGGQGWIRTSVRLRGQIYSLLPLTTRPPVRTRRNRARLRPGGCGRGYLAGGVPACQPNARPHQLAPDPRPACASPPPLPDAAVMTKKTKKGPLRGRAGRMRGGRGSGRAGAGDVRLWGRHAVEAALANPLRQPRILRATREAVAQLETAPPEGLPIEHADASDLDRLVSQGATHQGLVLDCRALEEVALEDVLARERNGSAAGARPGDRPAQCRRDPAKRGGVRRGGAGHAGPPLAARKRRTGQGRFGRARKHGRGRGSSTSHARST